MSDNSQCPNCSSPVDTAQADGLCPACLMKAAMQPAAQSGTVETMDRPRVFDAPQPAELSRVIESVEIQELIGYGGMGAVYLGKQKNLDRPVAIKIIAPRLSDDPGFLERFSREAKTLARLNHPNIVTVYDFGQAGAYCYLIMELVEGVNLRDAILSGGVTPAEALQIVPKVCDALQYAHGEGVVHRDIKPENILVGLKNEVKIADFGLAKMLDKKDVNFTLTGTQQVLGTRNYMAPEQIERPSTVDHRADIYSLGVVFYELLTGELPLGRFSLPSEKANVNGQTDDVVLRTLEKEPARRFQQASEVKTAVEALSKALPPVLGNKAVENNESPIPNVQPADAPIQKAVAANQAPAEAIVVGRETAEEFPDRVSGKTISLPFSNDGQLGGISPLHGLAHLRDSFLEIEFRVHRFGVAKSAMKTVQIPFNKLAVCHLNKGVFSQSLELQGTSLDVFDELPGTSQGRLKLDFEKSLKPQAEEFHERLQSVIRPVASLAAESQPPVQRPEGHSLTALEQVSFKIGNVHSGQAEAVGIAKVTAEKLVVEFDIIDVFGVKKQVHKHVGKKLSKLFGEKEAARPAIVHIPYENVVAVRFRKGVISNLIEIQTNSLGVVSEIPNSKQGKFGIRVPKKETEASKAWVRRSLQLARLPMAENVMEAKPQTDEEQLSFLRQKLAGPRWALIGCIVLCGLWLSLLIGALAFSFSKWDQIDRHLDQVELVQWTEREIESGVIYRSVDRNNPEVLALRKDQPIWMPAASELVYQSGLRKMEHMRMPQAVQFSMMFLVAVVGPSLAILIGLSMLLGLIRIRNYGFIIAGGALFLLPIHFAALVTVPVGVWLLVVMLQPKTKQAFVALQNQ